ncbi:hypothetical protein TRVL_05820 [Trypanosoma vivax]|nr:hypothetical protein TRVL_05820 [Trypanosoma vivax]
MPPIRFSDAVEKALSDVCPTNDPVCQPGFDPVGHLNSLFLDEASLDNLPTFVDEVKARLKQTESALLRGVEAQAANATTAEKDLRSAKTAVIALHDRVLDIKGKAAKSQDAVQELCRHIRRLDVAKTNLNAGISMLRSIQLWMLQLQSVSISFERRKFNQCRDALLEAQRYASTFEHMKEFPIVKKVNSCQAGLFKKINHYILHSVFGNKKPEPHEYTTMAEACGVVDLLGNESVKALRESFIANVSESYDVRFKPGQENAKLERTERRYVHIRNLLEQYESMFHNVFPKHWCVPQELCVTLCLRTKADLDRLLAEEAGDIDVVVLAYVLQKTLDIERDLTRMMAWRGELRGKSGLPDYKYNGMILSSFKNHMGIFVSNEDKLMGDALSQPIVIEVEKNGSENADSNGACSPSKNSAMMYAWNDDSDTSVGTTIPMAEDIFIFIKESLKRTLRISQQDVLIDMAAVWRKHLLSFSSIIAKNIPTIASTREEMRRACIIINTTELCRTMSKNLGDEVCTRCDVPAKELGFDRVSDAFSALYSSVVVSIVKGTESNMSPFLSEYCNEGFVKQRKGEQDIHDESQLIRSMSSVLHDMLVVCAAVLPSSPLRFLLDKIASTVIPLYTDIFYRMRRLSSDFVIGLMRIDSAALERTFLQLPNYNKPERFLPTLLTGYNRCVRREFDRFNRMLKVLQVDATKNTFVDVYHELILPEDRSIRNFVRLIELKGRKREDVRAWIASLSKLGVVEATQRDMRRDIAMGIAGGSSAQSAMTGLTGAVVGGKMFSNLFHLSSSNNVQAAGNTGMVGGKAGGSPRNGGESHGRNGA